MKILVLVYENWLLFKKDFVIHKTKAIYFHRIGSCFFSLIRYFCLSYCMSPMNDDPLTRECLHVKYEQKIVKVDSWFF